MMKIRLQLLINITTLLFSKIKEIYFGVYFYIFKNDNIEIIAFNRKKECDKCLFNSTVMKKMDKDFKPWRKDEHCIECKCNLKFKQRSLGSKCPNKLW